jgi:toxin FitB
VSFLLDTDIVSEWVKHRPNPHVISWLTEVDEDRVFLSVASIAEIRHGIERLPAGRRRGRLTEWLEDELPGRFEDRLLPVDHRTAEHWGVMMARGQRAGFNAGWMDALLAATADAHQLMVVTRNSRDFRGLGVPVVDPWESGSTPD